MQDKIVVIHLSYLVALYLCAILCGPAVLPKQAAAKLLMNGVRLPSNGC